MLMAWIKRGEGRLTSKRKSSLSIFARNLGWTFESFLARYRAESPIVSATIRAVSSALHRRRRPLPVNTSSRRAGSVIAFTHSIHSKPYGPNLIEDFAIHTAKRKVTTERRL